MNDRIIKKVAVVATGVIGASWVVHYLAHGLSVSATDPSPGASVRLRSAVEKHWATLTTVGLAPSVSLDRLTFHPRLEDALQGADFVQENGPESIDFKVDLFGRMDAVLPPEVILASSSSGLSTSTIQAGCRHPERVVLGHPFNPPHLIPLVEVIGGRQTSLSTIERTMAFYRSVGKRPIHGRREIPGHIANRLQAALWREAFHLVDQGVATVEDVDTAIAFGPGLRWGAFGPFLNLHFSGGEGGIRHVLDHLGGPIEAWWNDLGAPAMTEALKAKVVSQTAEALKGKSVVELEAARDRMVMQLLQSKPSESSEQ